MRGISLTASMRSNLLSLQNISGQVDSTQNRLATGKKVNSAIDNPSSYYTALSLNNRADDLNALLDSMGQAISTIKAATTALESATEFLEQAKAVANQALESSDFKTFDKPIIAQVSTEEELLAAIDSGNQGLIVLKQDITMTTNQNIVLKDGQSLVGARYLDTSKQQTKLNFNFDGEVKDTITVGNGTLISDLEINVKGDVCGNYNYSTIKASTKTDVVYNDIDINLNFDAATDSGYYTLLGGEFEIRGNVNICYNGSRSGDLDVRGICWGTITLNDAILNLSNFSYETSYSTITINNNSEYNGTSNFYNFVYSKVYFNDASSSNLKSEKNFCGTELYIQSSNARLNISGSAPFFEGYYPNYDPKIIAASGATIKLSSGTFTADGDVNVPISGTISALPPSDFKENAAEKAEDDEKYKNVMNDFEAYIQKCKDNRSHEHSPAKDISFAEEYNNILNQYDSLIKDASYKGINLLQTDKLSVKFNEDNTASLNVQGKDMSSKALGFTIFDWQTQGDINKSIDELTSAINAIRNYSSELGNNYNIITTRQDFTESLINVLTEGADKLTLADMNEESANMLALQTRQQLAINSLSLASQASQSILKLF